MSLMDLLLRVLHIFTMTSFILLFMMMLLMASYIVVMFKEEYSLWRKEERERRNKIQTDDDDLFTKWVEEFRYLRPDDEGVKPNNVRNAVLLAGSIPVVLQYNARHRRRRFIRVPLPAWIHRPQTT